MCSTRWRQEENSGEDSGEEPGPSRPSLSPQSSSPKSRGLPQPERRRGEAPAGGAGRRQANPDPAGEPWEPRGLGSAVGRGGGKPDLIGKERSKGRLICPPGSWLAPSARRGSRISAEEGTKGRGLSERPGDRPASLLHFGVRVSRLRGWREATSGLQGRQVNSQHR